MLPVTTFDELRRIGWNERRAIDLKIGYRGDSKVRAAEIAKDIAAFANATGGVIVVGAAERKGDDPKWVGVTLDEARSLKHEFETVARGRCRPAVRLDAVILDSPDQTQVGRRWPGSDGMRAPA